MERRQPEEEKSSKAACVWGRGRINSSGRRTETKDNQLVRDGITIRTVTGADSMERVKGEAINV